MRKILSSGISDEPYGSLLQLNYPPPPVGRWTDANPRVSEAPKANNTVFFSCQKYFCVCRKIHLHSRNISLCRAWNRCVCCNIDCEHWHRMWFSFLPFIFEANWFHPFQMCLARHSYLYFHSGYSANGVIYITWNKLSWLRGLKRHIHSTCMSLAVLGFGVWVVFFKLCPPDKFFLFTENVIN